MKKTFIIIFLLFFSFIFFVACENNKKIENNISEITKIYFQGESADNDLICFISVGERENPYKVDGVHNPVCDFSLISLKLSNCTYEQIKICLIVNDEESEVILYHNPISDIYINDIGYALNENDVIKVGYGEINFNVYNISKDFKIDYQKALDISFEKFSEQISSLYKNGQFMGECYLKILSNSNNNQLFWYFSIQTVTQKTMNLILSVDSGEVVVVN